MVPHPPISFLTIYNMNYIYPWRSEQESILSYLDWGIDRQTSGSYKRAFWRFVLSWP